MRSHQGCERTADQRSRLQGSRVPHLADDDAGRHGRRRRRRSDVEDDRDALTAGSSAVDDYRSQRGSGRERLGVGRNFYRSSVGSRRRIEGQPPGAALVNHGDAPGHIAVPGVANLEAAGVASHRASAADRADPDGRGFERKFGRQDNGSHAIAQHFAIVLHVTAAKRGMGAVAEAVATEDTGARAMVSCAIAGAVTRGRAMNVGNCADSSTFGLAAATS